MPADDRAATMHAGSHEERLGERYRLIERVGLGGVAEVWRGFDERLGRAVAVKILGPQADETFRRRFAEEARRAATISHPNVVRVYDAAQQADRSYIVMEFVEGRSLDVLLRERGPFPLSEVGRLVSQIAAAIDAAHGQGLVHCDVKPANIIVGYDGTAKLTDFGIARASESSSESELIGTARYVAPEQVRGSPATSRSDLYALGLVAYELIAGRPAFPGADSAELLQARLTQDPPRLHGLRLGVRPEVEAVIERALARDPARRYARAGQFARALSEAIGAGDPTEPLPTMRPAAALRARLDRRTVLLVLALGLVALGVVSFFRAFGGAELATVPDVRGQRYEQAVTMLRDRGLSAGRLDVATRERVGTVVDQRPPPGTQLRRGDVVTLSVSTGRVATPTVVGKKLEEAARILIQAGFRSPVPWEVDRLAKGEPGTVARQEPAAGVEVEAGQPAKLWIVDPRGRTEK